MLSDESYMRFFCMTRAARALEIACDSGEQKLYRLNQPLGRPQVYYWFVIGFKGEFNRIVQKSLRCAVL